MQTTVNYFNIFFYMIPQTYLYILVPRQHLIYIILNILKNLLHYLMQTYTINTKNTKT